MPMKAGPTVSSGPRHNKNYPAGMAPHPSGITSKYQIFWSRSRVGGWRLKVKEVEQLPYRGEGSNSAALSCRTIITPYSCTTNKCPLAAIPSSCTKAANEKPWTMFAIHPYNRLTASPLPAIFGRKERERSGINSSFSFMDPTMLHTASRESLVVHHTAMVLVIAFGSEYDEPVDVSLAPACQFVGSITADEYAKPWVEILIVDSDFWPEFIFNHFGAQEHWAKV
ncbi:hypothetical protein BDM02DRAFT_3264154 [Thelephora ganbajun]|uniref:Uncharacterized protein n=1 Tax=Thelephora ganbajun TaxID=370292 RepID=A0ACB6Z1C5_THEGA|nr:hypothetical protein BDM02DRAFT_3264154 [Thelephora ganbajun]